MCDPRAGALRLLRAVLGVDVEGLEADATATGLGERLEFGQEAARRTR